MIFLGNDIPIRNWFEQNYAIEFTTGPVLLFDISLRTQLDNCWKQLNHKLKVLFKRYKPLQTLQTTLLYKLYKPQLRNYFQMYRCQLNFAMFCATSAVGISWQHLTIWFFLCAVFIGFMFIFMYECYYIIKVFLFHMTIVLIMLKLLF